MELNNEFRVAVPATQTWEVLTDVERVAPCLPGTTLLSVDGDNFTGAVKVKVGPITVSYQGNATFQEKDAQAQRVVLKAIGKETRGNGRAAAVVTAQLKDDGTAGTLVSVTTELTISGKAAQFGRGVLSDVAGALIDQFAGSLEAELLAGAEPATENVSATTTSVGNQGGSINALALAKVMAVPMAKRFAPTIGAVAVAGALGFLLGRLRSVS
ncbi:SRPBCC family protein [Mycolicibacterium brisbanense]|uniref:Carbon monoxide dehydrogenase subunit G n=1 Tax=Mycolicibacterium brisbanense TaxID=146020 RepID=A0A100W615_9MYCO|nr:SRPBCC family protein [Mycolicibacterium brisbanense]MCV7159464.1 SRPBCC family protein [Mycolicibacterium brisbanense]GAS92251.1 carbon monoxide dehydrogenase subunit G [Mycolicibacterium brisbanense]